MAQADTSISDEMFLQVHQISLNTLRNIIQVLRNQTVTCSVDLLHYCQISKKMFFYKVLHGSTFPTILHKKQSWSEQIGDKCCISVVNESIQ